MRQDKLSMMSTQSRKDGTETPPPVNTDEIAAMQKQMHEKERRLREEERAFRIAVVKSSAKIP